MRRRCFLKITAAAGILAASPARAFRLDPVEWRGVALGGPARLTIHHEDRAEALKVVTACVAEIERLERIFSLYRPDTAIVRLNAAGRLDSPPLDMVALLAVCDRVWRRSEGAFDPTVQPLWDLHARHFAAPGADPAGPSAPAIEQARELVGWGAVAFGAETIFFRRPGMGLTLNGIAQGYVTDRVADLLKHAGMRRVLVDMGEIAASGDWRVGLPGGRVVRLRDEALAVTDPDGTRFSPCCHHLFDPATGRSAKTSGTIVIHAASATEADALSTATAIGGSRG